MLRLLSRMKGEYKVIKEISDEGPLERMIKYSLRSNDGKELSFWNDVPFDLKGDTVNCVIEIPKEKHGKFEVKKHIRNHPIMQDTRVNIFSKATELRFYSQFPLFNYGYIPQTWEQNLVKNEQGLFGDDDPIDICDLSENKKKAGEVFRGKILGGFCLIDEGEIDWKLMVMDERESREKNINDIEDIDARRIDSIKKWFKIVKVFDGKKENTIAYGEKVFGKNCILKVIAETRKEWVNLMTNEDDGVELVRRKHQIERKRKEEILT